jgi:hypothetical protein
MQDRGKACTNRYDKIRNDWHYDASCIFTSLPVPDLEHFKHLIFTAQCTNSLGISWGANSHWTRTPAEARDEITKKKISKAMYTDNLHHLL